MSKKKSRAVSKDVQPIEPDVAAMTSRNSVQDIDTSGGMLSLQQVCFVNALFTNECLMDPAKAAIAAGYSVKNAQNQGSHLMRHPLVREMIETRLARLSLNTELTPKAVMEKLWLEANNHEPEDSSPTARVSALKHLSVLLSMVPKAEKPAEGQKVVVNINLGGDTKTATIEGTVVNE